MPDDHEHDCRLAARAGEGDERAFGELVERHRDPLLRYVARRFRPELAEDAVQEALLSAHRALIGGTRPNDVRAWLSTIAWRRALDMSRRERDALPLDTAVAGRVTDEPEARAIQSNELGRVVAAMSGLPERQRTALRLSALEGRSLEEIGDVLHVAPDAAKSLVARSRRTLTHRLAAADLDCDEARLEMESATLRGVRLSGTVTLHLEGCRACARAHRAIRRRRRVAAILPLGLLVRTAGIRDKLRDLIAFNPAWEAQIGAAKMCTAACLTLGGATVVAPTVTVAVPIVAQQSTATPEPAKEKAAERKRKKQKAVKPNPTVTPAATVALAAATPVRTATPTPTASGRERRQRKGKPRPYPALGESAATTSPMIARPKRDAASMPEPVKTPAATPSPAATPPPAATPTPIPAETPTPPPAG